MFYLTKQLRFLPKTKQIFNISVRQLTHEVPPLHLSWNWQKEGFPPLFSSKGLEIAYFQKQKYHLDELNRFIKGTVYEDLGDVESIAHQSAYRASHSYIYNHAAQAFNNHFFFLSLKKTIEGKTEPDQDFLSQIISSFEDFHSFKEHFIHTALAMFGSGWVWLVDDLSEQKLKIFPTFNAGQPYHERRSIAQGLSMGYPVSDVSIDIHKKYSDTLLVPLLVVNCWEYAWIYDYGVFGKETYLRRWFDCINWDVVVERQANIWKTNEIDVVSTDDA
ncbi:hypothetical protein PORY_001243 [Pneumocystis oryctolagi]|uniref:Uncharacterized protein n=1 Tax=Pneumocystis oryctolagi TaxID=42067 RepID=A0ACB7CDN6_9ASCO|nr:hypothetical protein PORY_001243 [Pneumocystis oryctolagi]